MPLPSGTRLGPYEILAPVGAGGMGEVYKARDTRLDRIVAIKVSGEQFSERFEREARAIAALNHSNICTLHDVGPNYLVMEYIEGTPLKGPLPLDVALKYAAQICDALDAAHRKGITHRDLKPANILITKSGIKLLDFGLAKITETAKPLGDSQATLSMALTGKNEIVGTLNYMSPEQLQAQATGQEIDARTDIFSFGLVLYEMLTGKRAFEGSSPASVIAAIMERPAPTIAEVAPPALDHVLQRCLKKDPDDRWQSVRDLKAALEWTASPSSTTPSSVASTTGASAAAFQAAPGQAEVRHRERLGWIAAAAALVGLGAIGFLHFSEVPPEKATYQLEITPPPGLPFSTFRLSPDGRAIAFIAGGGQRTGGSAGILWIRRLDTGEAHEVPGTDGATYPFWSPDGKSVAFYHGGKLKKVLAKGGPPEVICDLPTSRGGTWGPDGTILLTDSATSPLLRVPANGGKPVPLTKLKGQSGQAISHRAPEFLPDGIHFLFLATSNIPDARGIFVGSLKGDPPVRLLPDDTNATFTQGKDGKNGHVFFLREGVLMAAPFDLAGTRLTGDPFPVAENVAIAANNRFGAFSSSSGGSLAYWTSEAQRRRELVWMDRSGKRLAVVGTPGPYRNLALAPDEQNVLVSQGTNAPLGDLWLLDLKQNSSTRYTFNVGGSYPAWAPDGSVFYAQWIRNPVALVRKSNGNEEVLGKEQNLIPTDVSPDGKLLAFNMATHLSNGDIRLMTLDPKHEAKSYLANTAEERNARFSPDGKWLAYQSNESGRFEIYMQTIPADGAKYQLSAGAGGTQPMWNRNGKELFYLSLDQKIMSVPLTMKGTAIESGAPKELFTAPGATDFAATRDGQRFLVIQPVGGESAANVPITVITNWAATLKK